MIDNFYIGTELFINKDDTPELVKHWVKQISESNMNIIRLFVYWDHVEPKEGVWIFDKYDCCFEEADKYGIKVVPTLMSVSPPGWMKLSNWNQHTHDIDDKKYWALALDYVHRVAKRYKDYPALHSWILWNEPTRIINPNANSVILYREFLRKIYNNNINELNKYHYKQYSGFDEIGIGEELKTNFLDFKGYVEELDWMRFSVDNLCQRLSDIKEIIRRNDETHPIHINPHSIAHCTMHAGQSIWKEAELVDFLGCSAHPAWHSTRFHDNRIHQSVSYFSDLMRSSTPHPDGLFWVSELQGGTTIYSSPRYFCPTSDDITAWMWESIGAGAKGIVFWCFNVRNNGRECGEWGLLNQMGEPSERLMAATKVLNIVQNNIEDFIQAMPPKPDVWLLYSENSWALGWVEGTGEDVDNPRNKHMAADGLCACYLMCQDLGLQVGFINEEKFNQDGLEDDDVLIVPNATSMEVKTCQSLKQFVTSGGTLIADGLIAMKDCNGGLSNANKDIIDTIFGAKLKDIQAASKKFNITKDILNCTGWFIKCSFECDEKTEIIGQSFDKRAQIIRHKLGKGAAVRIGTAFFQQYLIESNNDNLKLLDYLLPDIKQKRVRLNNPSFDLRLKYLIRGDKTVIILINTSDEKEADLIFDKSGDIVRIDKDELCRVIKGKIFKYRLLKKETAVFIQE